MRTTRSWSGLFAITSALVLLGSGARAEPDSLLAERTRQKAEFNAIDPNKDGRLAFDEMTPAMRPWMRQGDRDGDGALDADEYIGYLNQPGADYDVALPENVELLADLPYAGTAHHRQQVDVYLPKNRANDKALPVIAYVHGGGWSLGSRLMARPQVAPHVASGNYAAVAIGYRLSGEVSYPAPLHDLKAGIRWIRANAAKHGFHADRICVMGSSAGGHLTSLIATTNGSPEHEGKIGPHTSESSDVQCAIPLFGSTDLRIEAPESTGGNARRKAFLGEGGKAAALSASPIAHADRTDPPFYFIHGTQDPLVAYSHSVQLDRELRELKVPSALLTIDGGGHGNFFNPEITRRVRRFLDFHLRRAGSPPESETVAYTPSE